MHYLGLLANAHPLLTQLRLSESVRFEVLTFDELLTLQARLRGTTVRALETEYLGSSVEYPHVGGEHVITVRASFEVELRELNGLPPEISIFHEKVIQRIVEPSIELIRLWSPSNLQKVSDEYFTFEDSVPRPKLSRRRPRTEVREYLTLREGDIGILQDFIDTHHLPPPMEYTRNALATFDLGYSVSNPGVAFSLFITCLEVILDSGAHRVARNAAVLLGSSRENAVEIFTELKRLHELRSNAVHSGKFGRISAADLIRLRNITRDVIRSLLRSRAPKKQLLAKLNEMGFGDDITPALELSD